MTRNIFFDLDETLLDTSERHYHLYCDIIKFLKLRDPLPKEEFWELKRKGIKTVEILDESDNKILKKFSELWIDKIEKRNYLLYDKPFSKTFHLLSQLKKERLILLTMRNNRKNLVWEIKKLGLYDYFECILSCSPLQYNDKTDPIIDYDCYKNSILNENSIIIGDSEIDIITGKKLNMTTVAVSYGIRSKEILISQNPDYCLKDMNKIIDVIKSL